MKKLLLLIIIPFIFFGQNTDCGDKPLKPVKSENETRKDYKSSEKYLSYKEVLKKWKHCMSPIGISERIEENLEKKGINNSKEIINPCGDKPKKPQRLQDIRQHD